MEYEILAVGVGLIGAFSGLIVGTYLGKTRFSEKTDVLRKALGDMEDYHKAVVARMRGQIKEYSQPSELQRMDITGMDTATMIDAFVNNISSMQGLPKWMRPFIPAIGGWAKENPDQVKALIMKFGQGAGEKAGFIKGAQDTL